MCYRQLRSRQEEEGWRKGGGREQIKVKEMEEERSARKDSRGGDKVT